MRARQWLFWVLGASLTVGCADEDDGNEDAADDAADDASSGGEDAGDDVAEAGDDATASDPTSDPTTDPTNGEGTEGGSAEGGSTGASAEGGTGGGAACEPDDADDTCVMCTKSNCCPEIEACNADDICVCMQGCVTGIMDIAPCTKQCGQNTTFGPLTQCAASNCAADCL